MEFTPGDPFTHLPEQPEIRRSSVAENSLHPMNSTTQQPESNPSSEPEPHHTPDDPSTSLLPKETTDTSFQKSQLPPVDPNTLLPLQLELAAIQEQLKTLNRLSQVMSIELNLTDPSTSSSPRPTTSQHISSLIPFASPPPSQFTSTQPATPFLQDKVKSSKEKSSSTSFITTFASNQQNGKLLSVQDPWFQSTLAEFRARQAGEKESDRGREWEREVEVERGVVLRLSVHGDGRREKEKGERKGKGRGEKWREMKRMWSRGWLVRRWREMRRGDEIEELCVKG